ncbi:glycosyl hydrolase, family 88 [Streptomyces albus]|uniref:Glycosyl hydrolase, family 88 n=1 Tax=Streptomyces albus (strain ATCC 21838 / DSM 41398 / FERM P-419 / JCM 4703 / NBRC 107858) TaxID=1081613 RepID=A0A0B5EUU5_STRA4|nr:glycosyl hydrolase, family 88 [Streptomyces albus]AOU79853.1 glycosyl hydrolase, family 88 [Streptomyces albus]AYN35577.1 glycosyl hydrolase family 88 [Streptomyces albus]
MNRRQLLFGAAAVAATAALAPVASAAPARTAPPPLGTAVRLPSREEIAAVLRRVADHWIGAHQDPGDNGWARATFFSGLTALHRLTGEGRYLDYARDWAEGHDYGLIDGVTTRHADNQCAGQTYLDLYALEPEPGKITAIEECLHRMVAVDRPEKDDDWWWDDALHMAMPPFARIAVLREQSGQPDRAAFEEKLHRLYTHTRSAEGGPGLLDPDSGLWYRDKRFIAGLPGAITSPAGKPVRWSRGNGWVAGGHVKTLQALPPTARDVPEYRATLAALLTAAREVQRPDGFWNVNLADPDHLPGPETSGTSFFAYGTAFALRTGLVDRAAFLPVAARAWQGLATTAVQQDGFLGWVQGVGDRPESSQPIGPDTTADFGVGAFLLAGTELALLADQLAR